MEEGDMKESLGSGDTLVSSSGYWLHGCFIFEKIR